MEQVDLLKNLMRNKQRILDTLNINIEYWSAPGEKLLDSFLDDYDLIEFFEFNKLCFSEDEYLVTFESVFTGWLCPFCERFIGLCYKCPYGSMYGVCNEKGSAWREIDSLKGFCNMKVDIANIFHRHYVPTIIITEDYYKDLKGGHDGT